MKSTDLLKELEQSPIISGSRDIGWLIKKRVDGKRAYKRITLPPGTPYQTAVKVANTN